MSFTPPQRCVGYLVQKELFWPEFFVLRQLLVQVSQFLFTTTPARTEIVKVTSSGTKPKEVRVGKVMLNWAHGCGTSLT